MGVLDLEEWELVLAKMHRHHANVAQEVAIIVQTIRKEMKSELVPLAEEKATYGKIVKSAIRELWALEYEIQDILMAIRIRQKTKMEEIKTKYWEVIKDLEPLKQPRPPKPKDEPKKPEEKKADAPAEPKPADAPAPAPVT